MKIVSLASTFLFYHEVVALTTPMRTIHPMMSPISRLNFVLEAKKGNNGKKRKNGSKSKSTAALKEVLLSDKDSDVTTLKQGGF